MTDSYIRSDDGALMVMVAPHQYVSVDCGANPKKQPPRCRSPEKCTLAHRCEARQ